MADEDMDREVDTERLEPRTSGRNTNMRKKGSQYTAELKQTLYKTASSRLRRNFQYAKDMMSDGDLEPLNKQRPAICTMLQDVKESYSVLRNLLTEEEQRSHLDVKLL